MKELGHQAREINFESIIKQTERVDRTLTKKRAIANFRDKTITAKELKKS